MTKVNLTNKRVIVLAHILTTVPAQDLKEYLINSGTKEVLFIGHPLYYKKGRPGSFVEYIKDGHQTRKIQLANWNVNQFIRYFLDIILSLYWVLTGPGTWDIMITLDNLNSFTGLILRSAGKVKKVIYYAIDFTPQRFSNKLLNNAYHALEKFCVNHADLTWNVSPRISEGRHKLLGMAPTNYSKQITVPIGVWLDRIKRDVSQNVNLHTAVYAGSLSPHQGIQVVLEAIPQISEKIPDFKFLIIGMGDYESELKNQVRNLKVENYVNFLGYFEHHEDVEKTLLTCGLGVAMYSEQLSKWSYYADPSKIKSYLACGLPVITTGLTYIAIELVDRKCGLVCSYSPDDVSKTIITIMTDPAMHHDFQQNALLYAQDFDWNTVFSTGLATLA